MNLSLLFVMAIGPTQTSVKKRLFGKEGHGSHSDDVLSESSIPSKEFGFVAIEVCAGTEYPKAEPGAERPRWDLSQVENYLLLQRPSSWEVYNRVFYDLSHSGNRRAFAIVVIVVREGGLMLEDLLECGSLAARPGAMTGEDHPYFGRQHDKGDRAGAEVGYDD